MIRPTEGWCRACGPDALLRRATAGRSSGEERIYRLELDAEWVGEE